MRGEALFGPSVRHGRLGAAAGVRRDAGTVEPQVRRLARAVALIVLGMSAIWCAGHALGHARTVADGVRVAAQGAEYALAQGGPDALEDMGDEADELVFRLFEGSAGRVGAAWGELPELFAEELVDPKSLGSSDVVSASGTVAFLCNGSSQQVRETVREGLEGKGWTLVCSDEGSAGDTYVKASGRYRWAFITTSEISGTVTVSMTVVGADEVV